MNIRYLGTTERYSEAVCAGGFVFLSGMVPENPEADAKAQTENVLAQIDRLRRDFLNTVLKATDLPFLPALSQQRRHERSLGCLDSPRPHPCPRLHRSQTRQTGMGGRNQSIRRVQVIGLDKGSSENHSRFFRRPLS